MNIVMFTNVFKPFIGGVPISISRLADGLRQNGHNVVIFAPQYPGDETELEGVIRCPLITFYNSERFDIPLTNIFSSKLKKQFKDMDVDVVHVHHPFWMGALGVTLAGEKDIPAVFTYHTRYEEYLHIIPFTRVSKRRQRQRRKMVRNKEEIFRMRNFLKLRIMPKFIQRFLKRCDGVILPTASMEMTAEAAKGKTYILPTGLDQPCYLYDENKMEDIRARYKGNKKYLFVTVSRVTKEKNLKFMIEALRVLKQKIGDNFRLMIVGTGDMQEELIKRCKVLDIEDNVLFVGQVPNEELSNYYRASDLFIFSSLTETQGIVLLEAMAQKLPVVAVDATGVRDIIEPGQNGYLSSHNKNEWCNRIIDALQTPALKEGAFKTAEEYHYTRIAKGAEEIYLDLIQKQKGDKRLERSK